MIWSKLVKKQSLDTITKAEIYTNLAASYRQTGKLRKAISILEKAITIYRKEQDELSQYLLAASLADQGQLYNTLNQINFSVPLFQEANIIAERGNMAKIIAVGYQGLGNANIIAGKNDLALLNYNKSLVAAQELGNKELIVVALNNLSNLYHQEYQKLESQAQSAKESGSIEADDLYLKASSMAQKALNKAKQAVESSLFEQKLFSAEALLQLINISNAYEKDGIAESDSLEKYSKHAKKILLNLPNSRWKAQALIDLAKVQENPVSTLHAVLKVAKDLGVRVIGSRKENELILS